MGDRARRDVGHRAVFAVAGDGPMAWQIETRAPWIHRPAASRVALRVHHPSDVVAGVLLGLAGAAAALTLVG